MNFMLKPTRPRVLVVGGAGYIGSHAVLALDAAGFPVTVLDDLSTGLRSAVPEHVRFHRGDAGDGALLDRIIRSEGIAAIMHFAGSIIVPDSVADPLGYYLNNTVKSRELIAAAVRGGVENFVFSSTAAVYGMPEALPIREDSPTQPINPYGASKLMTEWMLRDTAAAHPLRFVALRYFNVAGADPTGRSGQSTARATHLVKIACEHLVGKRPDVAIFGTDYPTEDGTAVRDYIHVSDLAEAHVLGLERLLRGGKSLVANCGYGRGFSVRQVLDAAARVAGRRLAVKESPRRAGDPPALVADCSRIRAELGWTPRLDDLDTIVAHALAWESRSIVADPALPLPPPVAARAKSGFKIISDQLAH